jgi:hypothetical protein
MSLLFSSSPRIHCKTVVSSLCPVHQVPKQLGFFKVGNLNPCGEFSELCIYLRKVQEHATKLTCADFATWCVLPAAHCQVYEQKVDILMVSCPSLIFLDAILRPTIAEYCG